MIPVTHEYTLYDTFQDNIDNMTDHKWLTISGYFECL